MFSKAPGRIPIVLGEEFKRLEFNEDHIYEFLIQSFRINFSELSMTLEQWNRLEVYFSGAAKWICEHPKIAELLK